LVVKLITSLHKIGHKFLKTEPKFTKFTHNTSLDSLNKHMCCCLQRIARHHRTKKSGVPPAAASLPKILYCKETNVASVSDYLWNFFIFTFDLLPVI